MQNNTYKIGIVGYGVVGQGIHKLFGDWVKAIYDPGFDKKTSNGNLNIPITTGKENFEDLDLIVISVPTNASKNGEADTSILEETIQWVIKYNHNGVILIKSTTPPSLLKYFHDNSPRIVFSPEYMGESEYFTPFWKYPDPKEMKMHTWQTFGGNKEQTSKCVDIFMRKIGPHAKFIQTDIVTAGLAKYMENTFYAMKVTFCNEWFDIAKAYEVDYNELREVWLQDPRISPMHTAVFPSKRGYSGKCFPKDVKAIVADSRKQGKEAVLMDTVDKYNEQHFLKQND